MKDDIKVRRFADVDVVKPKTLEALDEIHTEVFFEKVYNSEIKEKEKKAPKIERWDE